MGLTADRKGVLALKNESAQVLKELRVVLLEQVLKVLQVVLLEQKKLGSGQPQVLQQR